MTIAESDVRINASAHASDAGGRKPGEFRSAYGEDRSTPAHRHAAPERALFHRDTAPSLTFVTHVLVQALDVPRATALEAAQIYGRAPHTTANRYQYV